MMTPEEARKIIADNPHIYVPSGATTDGFRVQVTQDEHEILTAEYILGSLKADSDLIDEDPPEETDSDRVRNIRNAYLHLGELREKGMQRRVKLWKTHNWLLLGVVVYLIIGLGLIAPMCAAQTREERGCPEECR